MQLTKFCFLFKHTLLSLLHFLDTKGQLFQRRHLNKSGILFIFAVPVSRSLWPGKASSSHLTPLPASPPIPGNLSVCHFASSLILVVFHGFFLVGWGLLLVIFGFVACFFFFFLSLGPQLVCSLQHNFKFDCNG